MNFTQYHKQDQNKLITFTATHKSKPYFMEKKNVGEKKISPASCYRGTFNFHHKTLRSKSRRQPIFLSALASPLPSLATTDTRCTLTNDELFAMIVLHRFAQMKWIYKLESALWLFDVGGSAFIRRGIGLSHY